MNSTRLIALNNKGTIPRLSIGTAAASQVYQQLSSQDIANLESRLGLQPKEASNDIAAHVRGEPTNHASASLAEEASDRSASGNGVAEIDVAKA